jgi:undecaprenyl-diphosphatase
MDIIHAIILGIVEGITEFLPISSTGHLTIVEQLLGYRVDETSITAFTAVVQIGAILAAIVYFWSDIVRIVRGWCTGLLHESKRGNDYWMGWYIIIGSVPIAIIGILLRPLIETTFRGLWAVAIGLIGWSVVMYAADRANKGARHERDVTWKDALAIGLMQCFALIPGVSRSGATISAGLFRGIDRVSATRLSFFLGVPALLAAGGLQAASYAHQISEHIGWSQMLAGIMAACIVGYASIAWLLKFVSSHTFTPFIVYRVVLGVGIIVLLTAGITGA